MKFYNRENEIKQLQDICNKSYNEHSRFSVVVGRRRIGKTSLILTAMQNQDALIYLFVGRSNEADLCKSFCIEIASKLNVFVPEIESFGNLFRFLMERGVERKFTLVIDEFQEFENINNSIFSDIQNYWDRYRTQTNINFIVSGSIYSMMTKIFRDKKEPLFGRADLMLKLSPFSTVVLKQIMSDYKSGYTNDELLALYSFTGGIPKYVELLVDNKALSITKMVKYICQAGSPFIDEGRNLLIGEFGKKYGNYFSILNSVAIGLNTQSQIEAQLGEASIGGQLSKLETVYEVVQKKRPIFAKEGAQNVRYELVDNFLRFWFRYIEKNRSLVEMGNYEGLATIIESDYPTYSGMQLERYFKQQLAETHNYREIGSYWLPKGNENEIDIVAVELLGDTALAVEVKRNQKNFKPQKFAEKVEQLKTKHLAKYVVNTKCLTLEDM